MVLGSTVQRAESSKMQKSASRVGAMLPLVVWRPTWEAVLVQHHWTRVVRALSEFAVGGVGVGEDVSVSAGGVGRPFICEGESVRPRLLISVQRMGRPRPTEEMPPQALKKSPVDWSSMRSLTVPAAGAQWPGTWEGRSFRSGVQGLWSDTTVLITPSLAWSRSSDQSRSWFDWLRMGGQHLCRVSPSRTCSAARER